MHLYYASPSPTPKRAAPASSEKQFSTERNYPWRIPVLKTTTGSSNRSFQPSSTRWKSLILTTGHQPMTTTPQPVHHFLDSSQRPSNIRIVTRIEVAASEVS